MYLGHATLSDGLVYDIQPKISIKSDKTLEDDQSRSSPCWDNPPLQIQGPFGHGGLTG